MRCWMWGRDLGATDVVDMMGEDSVVEEDVEDMVFDEMCVRRKKRRRSV